jgi:choline monooxygenase
VASDVEHQSFVVSSTLDSVPPPQLEERISAGRGLPPGWYCDSEVFAAEQRLIFERNWQYVALAGDLARPGDYLTATIGRVPIVVLKDEAAGLRAFVNVCRHRCAEVVQGRGHRNVLQCHYHAWTYGLDGRLVSAPRSDRETSFDASGISLEEVPVAQWGPQIFVNLDRDPPPLGDYLGELPAQMAEDGLDFDRLSFHHRSDWVVNANWKVVIENYLECYHCPVAHPSVRRLIEVDPVNYRLESAGSVSRAVSPLKRGFRVETAKLPFDPVGPLGIGQFAFVWPNFGLTQNPGPHNAMSFVFEPLGADKTRVVSDYFFGDDADADFVDGLTAFLTDVGEEDRVLVESVQRGLASQRVPAVRMLLDSEELLRHFQLLVYGDLHRPA